jgi:hypothetical protein
MKTSRQNKVPEGFLSFYQPQLKLKQLLQSGAVRIDESNNEAAIIGLMILHFATFFAGSLYRQDKIANDKGAVIRNLAEDILEGDEYTVHEQGVSKLISFVDLIGKLLNTTNVLKIHIAMYDGYLDYEIYYSFHSHKKLFDFKRFCTLDVDTVSQMKSFNDASQAMLHHLNQNKIAT